jgi:hypothetical protein
VRADAVAAALPGHDIPSYSTGWPSRFDHWPLVHGGCSAALPVGAPLDWLAEGDIFSRHRIQRTRTAGRAPRA